MKPLFDFGTEDEPNPCGHSVRVKGCGGCDPGAIEWVKDDGQPWRRIGTEETA